MSGMKVVEEDQRQLLQKVSHFCVVLKKLQADEAGKLFHFHRIFFPIP